MALEQLIHNGVVVPEPPEYMETVLVIRGEEVRLTHKQEEMALAFARKKDTPYVQDPVFVANFLQDWSVELGLERVLRRDEVDFGPLHAFVTREKEEKDALTKEEKKALAAERRAVRESLKARYGHAIVNGQRVDLGTYMTEPSGIFMGRGEHPLRGRWKEGAHRLDITLNRSPDGGELEGEWAEIVWQPESMWVARWKDKLTGKLKYIWLSDTAPIKQEREARKFDKAIELDAHIDEIRARIEEGLVAKQARARMVATACYLIDVLCLRVGDEKDPDEADTVGATTLRPEHITIGDDGVVQFEFLGKDSVQWNKSITPPQAVLDNLKWLKEEARPSTNRAAEGDDAAARNLPQLFPDVTSRDVNAFFSKIMPGLSAKVFRTHHATRVVQDSLDASDVSADDAEYKKWRAASMANYEAALLCNHTKKYNGDWNRSKERYKARMGKARERISRYRAQRREYRAKLAALRVEAREKQEAASEKTAPKVRARYRKRVATAKTRIEASRGRLQRARDSLGKIEAQYAMADKKRTWNLGTSLKSYIDPRVYHEWGREVDYPVIDKYYPATLRRKFAWVRALDGENQDSPVTVRACMATDLVAVAHMFEQTTKDGQEIDLPVDLDEIGNRYLPSLQRSWREATIALSEDDEVVAFAVIGPEWQDDERSYLDVFAVLHPLYGGDVLVERLAADLEHRLHIQHLQAPRKKLSLRATDEAWFAGAPDLAMRLGLIEEEGADDESDDK